MKSLDVLKTLPRDEKGRIILDSLKENEDFIYQKEDKGKKKKAWMKFSDGRFLVKAVPGDTYEDYAELISQEICNSIGFPSADYYLGSLNGQDVVISVDFVKENETLISGKTFMASTVEILEREGLYKRNKSGDQKELNNLVMIEKCLSAYLQGEKLEQELKKIYTLFALNCFCLNGDIHLSNWSLLFSRNEGYSISPNYDAGSYFRLNLKNRSLSPHLKNLKRQKKDENIKKIIENDIFGGEYNRHNSLNFSNDSTEELGVSRLDEAYGIIPGRFYEIVTDLYSIDALTIIANVEKKLGAKIPEECADWVISCIEANQKLLSEVIQKYSQKFM